MGETSNATDIPYIDGMVIIILDNGLSPVRRIVII